MFGIGGTLGDERKHDVQLVFSISNPAFPVWQQTVIGNSKLLVDDKKAL